MARTPHPQRRKNYFINKEFQSKFIIKFFLLVLGGALLSTYLLFIFSQDTLTSSYQHSRLLIRSTAQTILPAIVYTNLITLVLITIAAILVTLFISHKIAGPMFRLERGLKELGNGDLTQNIKLRQKDQIAKLAETFNITAASLHEKMRLVRSGVQELQESAVGQDAQEELIEKINLLRDKIDNDFTL